MVNVVKLHPRHADSQWKMSFADSVIEMCPNLNPDAADEAADAALSTLRDADPAAAAAQWVRRHAWADRTKSAEDDAANAARCAP